MGRGTEVAVIPPGEVEAERAVWIQSGNLGSPGIYRLGLRGSRADLGGREDPRDRVDPGGRADPGGIARTDLGWEGGVSSGYGADWVGYGH